MTTAFTAVKTDRLAKLILLAFGSDKPGEIAAAIAAVKRLLAANNVDHYWLANQLTYQTEEHHHDDSDRSLAWWCHHHRDLLSAKEWRFVESLTRWRGTISARQHQWLHAIADKIEPAP
jgi:hypothetical protein